MLAYRYFIGWTEGSTGPGGRPTNRISGPRWNRVSCPICRAVFGSPALLGDAGPGDWSPVSPPRPTMCRPAWRTLGWGLPRKTSIWPSCEERMNRWEVYLDSQPVSKRWRNSNARGLRFRVLGTLMWMSSPKNRARWAKWSQSSGNVWDRLVLIKLKRTFYWTVLRSALFYWSVLDSHLESGTKDACKKIRMFRCVSELSRKDRVRNEYIRTNVWWHILGTRRGNRDVERRHWARRKNIHGLQHRPSAVN